LFSQARIATYDSLSQSDLNEDQIRSRASKPALELALHELNEVSKALASEKTDHQYYDEETVGMEVKNRLEKVTNQIPPLPFPLSHQTTTHHPLIFSLFSFFPNQKQPSLSLKPSDSSIPSDSKSLLSLLLQFLHLHSLVFPISSGMSPPVPRNTLKHMNPNQLAAVGFLHDQLARSHLVGEENVSMEILRKLQDGVEEVIFEEMSCESKV